MLSTAFLATGGITACSDNYDKELEPVQKALILKVDGHDNAFSEKYNAAQRSYDVNVESNTLWRVEANSTGGWISLDKVQGKGNESFSFTLRDNMLDKARTGSVIVYMVDNQGEALDTSGSSIALTVNQDFSNVRMLPSSLAPFPPTGNERILFTVNANVAWTLDVDYEGQNPTEFITISPESGDMQVSGNGTFSGNGEATFNISVADNRTSNDRIAYLNLRSDGDVGSYSVQITQNKSEYSFDVSPFEPQTVGARGDTLEFNVLSIVGWDIKTASEWVKFEPASYPDGSADPVKTVAIIAPNPTGDLRTATVRFIPKESNYQGLEVTIIQQGWDNAFDVTPKENRVIGATGGTLDFNILSMVGWSAISSEPWIDFSRSSSIEGNDNWVSTIATVAPNQSGMERSATLQFIPGNGRYDTVNIRVTQRGYDLMFEASPANGSSIIMENGGVITLDLDSRFRWETTAPSWLSVDPGSGNASTSLSHINVTAAANTTNDNRTGTVTITPLPTEFAGGVTLDPANLGIQPWHIGITQFGGREAAVSVPWLLDDYTQTSATVEFNFYSPFYRIVEAGLEWSKEDGSASDTISVQPSDAMDCTVSFNMTALDPATRYIARGYVKDSEGRVKYGQWSYPFTTAGRYPGSSDNPTPSR